MRECTLNELKEALSRYDEITILELLKLNSEDLVELLSDEIELKYEELLRALPDEDT